MQQQPGFNNGNERKPEGTVTIDKDAARTGRKSNDDGDYVDYEEIK